MKRLGAFCLSSAMSVAPLLAQDLPDLPSFDVEPPLLVQPDLKSTTSAEPSPSPAVDVAQLEKKLERAKRSAAAGERLYKIGAIAKVEAEQRALRVVRLQSDLAKAQLVNAQKSAGIATGMVQTVDVKPTSGVDSRIVFAEAKAAADTAVANLAKAELDAAAINVQRQKKLLALGSARKSDVVRAEEKLAALKNNNPR
jgi:hypothetical protein